jgi:hypothetical protein
MLPRFARVQGFINADAGRRSPKWLASPVPSQTMFVSESETARSPTASVGSSSPMGVQETPPFSVLKTPPVAPPVYQTIRLPFGTAISVARPLKTSGPMNRHLKSL